METIKIIIFAASFMLQASCSFAQIHNRVRVAVIQDAESINLKVQGSYEIIHPDTQEVLYRSKYLKTTVTTSGEGILLGKNNFQGGQVFLKTYRPDTVLINDRIYRGDILFIKKENSHLQVINYLDLEDYVKGILYHEASHYWPQEALKAQAVVCRTYAVYQMEISQKNNYDVTSDIYSQVYGGKASERYRTSHAVQQTRGAMLTFADKTFPAYYHATCAGHTEDASLLWNINIPPLKGVVCNFCKDSPHFNWHMVLALDEILDKLIKAGFQIKQIKDMATGNRDSSGRIAEIEVNTEKGVMKIPAKDFRSIIGPNIIRSTNFSLSIIGSDAVFEGLGWGHGVGLCQWGAYFMARQGYSYKDILKYYYPGAEIILR